MTNKTVRTGILITGNANGAIKQIKLTDDELARLNKTQRSSQKSAKELAQQWGTAAKRLSALGVATGATVAYMVKTNVDAQDSYAKLSQRVGFAVEELVGYNHAAALSGVSNEQLTVGFRQLNKNVVDFKNGTGEARVAFKALNIEVEDGAGKLKSNDQILREIADRFAEMEDGAEKTAYAMRIFGESGAQLIPFFNQGSAGLADMVEEGKRLNPVTEESAKQAEIFNDNLTRLKGEITSVGTSIVNDMLPAMSDMSSQVVDMVKTGEIDKYFTRAEVAAVSLSVVLMARQVPALVATTAQTINLARATGAATVASRGLMTLVGGPFGAAFIAAAGVTYGLTLKHREAAKAAQEHALEVASVTEGITAMTEAQLASVAVQKNNRLNEIRAEIKALEDAEKGRVQNTEQIRKLNVELDAEQSNYELLVRQLRRVQAGWKPVNKEAEEAAENSKNQAANLRALNGAYAVSAIALRNTESAYVDMMRNTGSAASLARMDLDDFNQMVAHSAQQTVVLAQSHKQYTDQIVQDYRDMREDISGVYQSMFSDAGNARDVITGLLKGVGANVLGDFASSITLDVLGANPSGDGFSFEQSLVNAGAAGSIIKSGVTKLAPGMAAKLGLGTTGLTESGYVALMNGGGGGLAGGISGAIKAIPGWGWALGAAALAASQLSKDPTPSFNEGFLIDQNVGLGKSGRDFAAGEFLSGLQVRGFNRRGSDVHAQEVIDLFRGLDSRIVNIASQAGLSIDASDVKGLDERGFANVSGRQFFFGSAGEEGKPGLSLDRQMNLFARGLIESLKGQISDADFNAILRSTDVDQTIAKLEEVLGVSNEFADEFVARHSNLVKVYMSDEYKLAEARKEIASAVTELGIKTPQSVHELQQLVASIDPLSTQGQLTITALEGLSEAIDLVSRSAGKSTIVKDAAAQFGSLTGSITSYLSNIREEQRRLIEDQSRTVATYYSELKNQTASHYTEQIRLERSLHDERRSLFTSLSQTIKGLTLGGLSGLNGADRLAFAKADFDRLTGQANNTSLSLKDRVAAARELEGASSEYLEAYRNQNASVGYQGVFGEVVQALESARFLGAVGEYDDSAAKNLIQQQQDSALVKIAQQELLELQRLNQQVGVLPPGIAAQLSPLINQVVTSGLASGQSLQQVSTRVDGIIATTGVTGLENPYAEHAFTKADAKNAVKGIVASASSEYEAVTKSAAALKDMGFSVALLDQLFTGVNVREVMKQYNIPTFMGGGYTGNGSRTGGVDGSGGFWSVVHPRETIIDHERGGLGALIAQMQDLKAEIQRLSNISVASSQHAGTQRTRQIKIAEEIKENQSASEGIGSGRYAR